MTMPDRIQITYQLKTMAMPDFCALCAELLPVEPPQIFTTMAMQFRSAWREGVEDGWNEARAVLARKGHPPAAAPAPGEKLVTASEDLATDQMMRANLSALLVEECGLHSSGSSTYDLLQRAAAMLVNYGLPARPATLPTPEPGEAKELHPLWYLIEFLEGHSSFLRRTDPTDELAQVLSDSATLLKRLAFPAYLVVGRPPEGCLEPLKSKSGQVEACTAGVSIELLGDAPRPTYLDAIRLAEGCHDYSGGHSGPEGEAWHGAIDTVVDVLKRAAIKPWDSQTMAVFGVGVESGRVAVPGPVSECPHCGYEGEMVPAPQAEGGGGVIAAEAFNLITLMADELDRLQPLPAFPPITSHPLAIKARAILAGRDCPATPPAPVAELDDQQREAVHQAVAEALGSGAYDCTRVWSAWSYGTMGPDDFVPVAENGERVVEIADAAIEAIRAIPAPQAGDVALAGDRRSAESLQLAHESCRLFGTKNGDCPDSEICWLDLLPCSHYENCATIPASQSGEGEA